MYDDKHKETMKGLADTCPALESFAHDQKNKLAAAIGWAHMVEQAETPVSAQMFVSRIIQALHEANDMYKEIGL